MKTGFLLVSVAALLYAALLTVRLLPILRQHGLSLRGIVKKIILSPEIFTQEELQQLLQWKYTGLALSLIPVISVAVVTWGTDLSFWIILFPVLWYYGLNRYFAWEKEDLLEHMKKNDH